MLESVSLSVGPLDVVTRPRLWLKTTSEKGPHLSCVVFTKRWQTREGTYQLKRRRLKLDVRDPPEDVSADVDMADI